MSHRREKSWRACVLHRRWGGWRNYPKYSSLFSSPATNSKGCPKLKNFIVASAISRCSPSSLSPEGSSISIPIKNSKAMKAYAIWSFCLSLLSIVCRKLINWKTSSNMTNVRRKRTISNQYQFFLAMNNQENIGGRREVNSNSCCRSCSRKTQQITAYNSRVLSKQCLRATTNWRVSWEGRKWYCWSSFGSAPKCCPSWLTRSHRSVVRGCNWI